MNSKAPRRRGLNGIAARHPAVTLAVLGVSGSYALSSLWGLAYFGGLPGGDLAKTLGVPAAQVVALLMLFALFPAAVYVTWASRGHDGVRDLFRRMLRWRAHPGWWAAALVALPGLTIGMSLLAGDPVKPADLAGLFVTQAYLLLEGLILVNLWEEAAWAGVFQTSLERRHNVLTAAVIAAVPFALVHLPLEFFSGYEVTLPGLGIAFVLLFVVGVLVRSMYGMFLRATGDSILLVALLHSMFNRTAGSDGIVAALVEGESRMLTLPLAVVMLTAMTAVIARRKLSAARRRELDRGKAGASDAVAQLTAVR